jgi:hypothetical protein
MIHRQFITPGQDGCWSGARVHDAQVELCLSTVRVPGPFIGDSSRSGKMKMARRLHLQPSPRGWRRAPRSGVRSVFPTAAFLGRRTLACKAPARRMLRTGALREE